MGAYLAEGYLASATPAGLRAARRRAIAAAAELAGDGGIVAYLRTIFLPPDQTCLTLFQAPSAEHVTRVCERAAIPCERVTVAMLPATRDPGERGGRQPDAAAR